jgi:DNA modification methylase
MAHEIREMAIADLEAAPYNPRKISAEALKGLSESLQRYGLVQPIVWNRRTRHVVGGHQRLIALKSQGQSKAQVLIVDLDLENEKKLNVALNNPSIEGEFDSTIQSLLQDVAQRDPAAFQDLRFDQLWKDLGLEASGTTSEEETPEKPKTPIARPGDLWRLHSHRLLCGDATSSADVGRALGGTKPELMVTDPPYGVSYDAAWRNKADREKKRPIGRKALGKVLNDDRADWRQAWSLFNGSVAYVWHADLHAGEVAASLEACQFTIRSKIIWAKNHWVFGRGNYHWQHEPCWYAVRGKARWRGGRSQTTLWQIDKPVASETEHPTQKPVECMRRPMVNNSDFAAVVYDPFLGSGSSLIAAETVHRTLVALELDPGYVDVAIERWQAYTGGKAIRS